MKQPASQPASQVQNQEMHGRVSRHTRREISHLTSTCQADAITDCATAKPLKYYKVLCVYTSKDQNNDFINLSIKGMLKFNKMDTYSHWSLEFSASWYKIIMIKSTCHKHGAVHSKAESSHTGGGGGGIPNQVQHTLAEKTAKLIRQNGMSSWVLRQTATCQLCWKRKYTFTSEQIEYK